jgi:recombination protein RecT
MTTNQLKVASGIPPEKREAPTTFPAMLEAYKAQIALALPQHMRADRMARIALTCFRMNPRLAQCTPASVFAAIIQAAQLGLEPGLMGQAYLIPYGDQCQLIPGYQGLLDLVRRTDRVNVIESHIVFDRDHFKVQFGTDPRITHEPYFEGDPGTMRLAYAVAQFKGGGWHTEVMSRVAIEKIRDRSQNVQRAKKAGKTTPWDTDTEEMWRKTVLRRICKFLPKSPELAMALALDDAASHGAQGINIDDAIANTFTPPPIEGESAQEGDGEQGTA